MEKIMIVTIIVALLIVLATIDFIVKGKWRYIYYRFFKPKSKKTRHKRPLIVHPEIINEPPPPAPATDTDTAPAAATATDTDTAPAHTQYLTEYFTGSGWVIVKVENEIVSWFSNKTYSNLWQTREAIFKILKKNTTAQYWKNARPNTIAPIVPKSITSSQQA